MRYNNRNSSTSRGQKAEQVTWNPIDVAALPDNLKRLYDEQHEAYKAFAEKREAFEEAFIAKGAEKGLKGFARETIAFTYKRGPVFAVVPPKAARSQAGGFSFDD